MRIKLPLKTHNCPFCSGLILVGIERDEYVVEHIKPVCEEFTDENLAKFLLGMMINATVDVASLLTARGTRN
jgi:hypothetical protein